MRYYCTMFSIVIISLLSGFASFGQPKFANNLNLMLNVHSGYNLPEYPFISAMTEDYIHSVGISLYKETTGKNVWAQIYNYPDYGLSLFYSTLGNDEIFGREIAITPFAKIYLLSGKRFNLYNHIGVGASYVNKKFDIQNNYHNVAIGSRVNVHFNYRAGVTYVLTKKLKFDTGLAFDHFSNANMATPNLGINYVTMYSGICCSIGQKIDRQIFEIEPHIRKNKIHIFASLGRKQTRSLLSKTYVTSSVSVEIDRSLSRKFHFGAGCDFFYDSSIKATFARDDREYSGSYGFQSGVHISQSLVYGKFRLSVQEGVYLGLPEKENARKMYNRGIFQYQLNNHLSVRLAMKSHLHILDYPELGIGYIL